MENNNNDSNSGKLAWKQLCCNDIKDDEPMVKCDSCYGWLH